jgi:hypothetical protein
LPAAVRRRLRVDDLAHAILSTDDFFPLTLSLDQIETYAVRARKLSTAVKMSVRRAFRERPTARRRPVDSQTFVSVHFFFTCWWMARVAVTVIRRSANRLGLAAVKLAIRPYAQDLELYAQGRHHFEHLDARLPGGDNEKIMVPRVYGMLHNGETFQFANGQWDVSIRGATRMQAMGQGLRRALLTDLLDYGARLEPEGLRRYLQRVAADVRAEALTRRVTRMLARAK